MSRRSDLVHGGKFAPAESTSDRGPRILKKTKKAMMQPKDQPGHLWDEFRKKDQRGRGGLADPDGSVRDGSGSAGTN